MHRVVLKFNNRPKKRYDFLNPIKKVDQSKFKCSIYELNKVHRYFL